VAEAGYENNILESFFATWRSVQHDIALGVRHGIDLHQAIVNRWYGYLDHVDSTVNRALQTEVRSAVNIAHASASAGVRRMDVLIPPLPRTNEAPSSTVSEQLWHLPHEVAGDIMQVVSQPTRALRTAEFVGFHRATVNAATPMLSRSMVAARTQIGRAGRDAVRSWLRESPGVFRGWTWQSSLELDDCVSCWAMHGSGHDLEDDLNDHPNGNCKVKPWLHGEDLPESGDDLLAKLPAADRATILGPTRLAWYREGRIALRDMVTIDRDPTWGPSITPTPVGVLAQHA
jgi:hypothetical protein